MREKIFKGKRKDNGEWVEGYHIVGCEVADYIIPHHSLENGKAYGGYEAWDKTFYVPEFFEVFTKTVVEFTGEYDRCHKRIFEDDFLKDENGFVYRVVFETGAFCLVAVTEFNIPYDTLPKDTDSDEFDGNLADNIVPIYVLKWNNSEWNTSFEIIGNLHDNPELLERRLPL